MGELLQKYEIDYPVWTLKKKEIKWRCKLEVVSLKDAE